MSVSIQFPKVRDGDGGPPRIFDRLAADATGAFGLEAGAPSAYARRFCTVSTAPATTPISVTAAVVLPDWITDRC